MFLQFGAGSVQSRADSSLGNPRGLSNVAIGQTLRFLQQKNRTQFRIKSRQGLFQNFPLLGGRTERLRFIGRFIVVVVECRLIPPLAFPQELQRLVDGQPVQPCLELCLPVVLVEPREHPQERLLSDIGCVLQSHHPHGQSMHERQTPFIQSPLRIAISGTATGNEPVNVVSGIVTRQIRCRGHGVSSDKTDRAGFPRHITSMPTGKTAVVIEYIGSGFKRDDSRSSGERG